MAKMEARLPGTKTAFSTFAGKAFADKNFAGKNFAGKNFAGKKFCGQKILLDTRTGIPYSGT
ncbi:hypothetical protein [uncultured Acetatifactor sp.]|uniref:hypothetical protein n=1 Tax=uncultured Acetatifactor sp. TaxID=1671927 RepID=UPI0026157C56|nr:hypothetical protein [uncultured Acetatifactor sp.]